MEGSHQKGQNWYRCRFVWNRGAVAADQAGHPRTLGIKEEVILDQLLDFMERRLFGPDRLRLLRHDLARSARTEWRDHDGEVARLKGELESVNSSMRRQTLRLEEHDDPNHPVVAAAKDRIEELGARRAAIEEAIRSIESSRPRRHTP